MQTLVHAPPLLKYYGILKESHLLDTNISNIPQEKINSSYEESIIEEKKPMDNTPQSQDLPVNTTKSNNDKQNTETTVENNSSQKENNSPSKNTETTVEINSSPKENNSPSTNSETQTQINDKKQM